MKKTNLKSFINLFILTCFVLFSCSNPFYGYTEAQSVEIPAAPASQEVPAAQAATEAPEEEPDVEPEVEPEVATEVEPEVESETEPAESVSEPVPATVSFSLSTEVKDIQILIQKKDSTYTLSAGEDCEKYYWKMGDVLLSSQKSFSLDVSSFINAAYPVVLLAERNEVLYSAQQFLTVTKSKARTVLPPFTNASLENLELKVFGDEEVLVSEHQLSSAKELSQLKISLPEGKYNLELTASCNGFLLSDSKALELQAEQQVMLDFILHQKGFASNSESSKSAKIDVINYFLSDVSVADSCVRLYKESEGNYVLCDIRRFSEGTLPFYKGKDDYEDKKYIRYSVEVEPGLYWFRCDSISADNSASYNMELIYAAEGKTSSKILETSDFYKLYSINYNMNGGFYTGAALTEKAASFDTVSFPSASQMIKKDCVFDGWYFDKEFSVPAGEKIERGCLNSNQTIYAKWKEGDSLPNQLCERLSVNETKEEITLTISDSKPDSIFVVEVYNSAGNLYDVKYTGLSFSEEKYIMNLGFKCRKSESYLISVSAYENVKLMNNNVIQELRFNEKYVFVPEFSHF